MKSFIITLTGSSACGKSYVAKKITALQNEMESEGVDFVAQQIEKYSTRAYREKEIKAAREGKFVDVISVEEIPKSCDFTYLSYGNYYGFESKKLSELLNKGICPVIVINDITALYDLKSKYKGRVLSLYIFRNVLNLKDMRKEAKLRGNSSNREIRDRYEKANTLHMNFLANVELFDRVILNVRDYTEEDYSKNAPNLTEIQVKNVITAAIKEKINLSRQIKSGHKLFIISGNAQSGKDDVIQGVRRMGVHLSEIVPKFTSRRQQEDDGDEMICRFIPNKRVLNKYVMAYARKREAIELEYIKGKEEGYPESFKAACIKSYNENSNDSFSDFAAVRWDVRRLNAIRKLKSPKEQFFAAFAKELKYGEEQAERKFFELNTMYCDLDLLRNEHEKEVQSQLLSQMPDEGPAYRINSKGVEYILYENNKKSDGTKYKYGFTVDQLTLPLAEKHVLLVSSLIKTLEICREILPNNTVTVFAYSQIDKEKYDANNKTELDKAKSSEYNDLKRYAINIVDFDHVLIYTESEPIGKSNGLKETLIEQMFKLFRLYQ